MKTKKQFLMVLIGALLLTVIGCGKKEKNQTGYNNYNNGQWVMNPQTGQCVSSQTGQPAPSQSYCNGYGGGGQYGGLCVGQYTWPVNMQTGTCYPPTQGNYNNCSGYQMLDQNRQMVNCQ